jgi:flagellar basal body-associated protein FliL
MRGLHVQLRTAGCSWVPQSAPWLHRLSDWFFPDAPHVMAARSPSPKPAALAPRPASDRWLSLWVVAALVVVICALLALSFGARWLGNTDPASPDQEAPAWLNTELVRATSGDGLAIKARVALDVPDADTRALIRRYPQQVALAMQIGAAAYEVGSDEGSQRVEGLSAHIQTHLNKYLVANRVAPVREVLIQDLVLSTP